MIDVVVLLGPPGSGKSTIGERLACRGLRWRDWESVIVERWGSREQFIARKAEVLPALHQEILEWIAAGQATSVIETTGLSDAPLLAELERSRRVLVVRLDVTDAESVRRVHAREQGRHLADDVAANRAVWRAFQEQVLPRPVDLVIDTERQSVEASVDAIAGLLATAR